MGHGVCRYVAGLTVRGSLARRPSWRPMRQRGLGAGRSQGGPADLWRGGRTGGGRRAADALRRRRLASAWSWNEKVQVQETAVGHQPPAEWVVCVSGSWVAGCGRLRPVRAADGGMELE